MTKTSRGADVHFRRRQVFTPASRRAGSSSGERQPCALASRSKGEGLKLKAADPETERRRLLIKADYVVVDVDVGKFDKNLDLAEKYHVPLKMGVPALAVLDCHGKLLYSQEHGEFEGARNMTFEDFKAFFEHWKPKK